jgi:hypothetical protein
MYRSYASNIGRFVSRFDFEPFVPQGSEFYESAAEIMKILDEALRENESQDLLRPDAKYFLLVNLHQLVVLPVLLLENPNLKSSNLYNRLLQYLRTDIRTLLNSLREESKSFNTKQSALSAHSVMQVLEKKWSELQLTGLDVWG